MNIDDAKEKLKLAGVPEDEMAALEKQLVPSSNNNATAKDGTRKVGFVSAGVESETDGGVNATANHEEIELPEESDSEEDDKVEIAEKDVPAAVYGGLARKREDEEDAAGATKGLGALERIKRLKRGAW